MEQGQVNEERVEEVYVMKERACITRNRSVWAACRRLAKSTQFPHSVGKRIAASRCFPSLVPFGSLRECRYYTDVGRRRRRYGFCSSCFLIHGRPEARRQHDDESPR